MNELSILIPCYNEEKTIKKVINDFRNIFPKAFIYVYDNNSSDNTYKIAKGEGAIVKKVCQQGKGNVVRQMFRDIDSKCYVLVDGDDTYEATDALFMVDLIINDGIDMVIGDRLSSTYDKENKRLFHSFGNKLVKKSINILFRSNVEDIMTGYRAFSYDFVKTFPVLSKGFEIETEMTIHAIDKRLNFKSIPIGYRDRPEGSKSKLNTIVDGIKVMFTILKFFITYRPLHFFSWLALLLILVATGFFIPVFIEYLDAGEVPNFPTLIVCGFTVIAAIQSFFTGLILQTIVQKNKQDFELEMMKLK